MDMDKFTKYTIYFLVGILAYYLLFNNGMVEGFDVHSTPTTYTVKIQVGDIANLTNTPVSLQQLTTPINISLPTSGENMKLKVLRKLLELITEGTFYYKNDDDDDDDVNTTIMLQIEGEGTCVNVGEGVCSDCQGIGDFVISSNNFDTNRDDLAALNNASVRFILESKIPLQQGNKSVNLLIDFTTLTTFSNLSARLNTSSLLLPHATVNIDDPTKIIISPTTDYKSVVLSPLEMSPPYTTYTADQNTALLNLFQNTAPTSTDCVNLLPAIYILQYPKTFSDSTDNFKIYRNDLVSTLPLSDTYLELKIDGGIPSFGASTDIVTITSDTAGSPSTCAEVNCSGTTPKNNPELPCPDSVCTQVDCCESASAILPPGESASAILPPGARPPPTDPCPDAPALIPGASGLGDCTENMANNGICIQLMTDGECTPTRCTNGVHHPGVCTKYKDYTCTNGRASTESSVSIDDEEKCDPAGCDPGFWYSTGDKKCHPIATCAGSVGLCETGESLNASATCNKAACDKSDCCKPNLSIEIGITLCIIICIAIMVGTIYLFSSRSRHKQAHNILTDPKTYRYKRPIPKAT